METQTQQPATTKGNPNARYSFKQLTMGEPFQNEKNHWLVNLRYDDVIICTIYGIDKMEALDNASRFVQAINMHDELVKFLGHFMLENELRKNAKLPANTKTLIYLAEKLLNQAEQK